MTITFTVGEAIELLKYGKFTLLHLSGIIDKKYATAITTIPMSNPAVEAVYHIKKDWSVITERFSWGSPNGGTSLPDKVYYELWNYPGRELLEKSGMRHENIGFYCGGKINYSNLDNVCTHILSGERVHVRLWNCSDPPEDVYFDFCVTPDTLVVCDGGRLKPISEIKVGERVLTHKGRYKKVTKIYMRPYTSEIIALRSFYAPEMKVTPNHQILVLRNNTIQWNEAREIKEGDTVLLSIPSENRDIETIKVSDYVKRNNISLDGEFIFAKNPNANIIPNRIPLTANFLRLVGYYLAEGCIASKGTALLFTFNINEEKYIEDTKAIMDKLFGLKPSKFVSTKNSTYRLTYGCLPLSILFHSLFGANSHEKHIPEFMMSLPKEKAIEVIKGVFRGDGCIHPNNTSTRIKIRMKSRDLINQIRLILLRLGYISTFKIEKDKNGDIYELYLDGYTDLSREIFDKDYDNTWQAKHPKRGVIKDGYLYTKILSKTVFPYNGYVYNLNVEEDHSYNLLGASVHNCVWYYTFRTEDFEKVMKILLRIPNALNRIATATELLSKKPPEITKAVR